MSHAYKFDVPHNPAAAKERIQRDIEAGIRCARCWLLLPCRSEHLGAVAWAGARRGDGTAIEAHGTPGRGW